MYVIVPRPVWLDEESASRRPHLGNSMKEGAPRWRTGHALPSRPRRPRCSFLHLAASTSQSRHEPTECGPSTLNGGYEVHVRGQAPHCTSYLIHVITSNHSRYDRPVPHNTPYSGRQCSTRGSDPGPSTWTPQLIVQLELLDSRWISAAIPV